MRARCPRPSTTTARCVLGHPSPLICWLIDHGRRLARIRTVLGPLGAAGQVQAGVLRRRDRRAALDVARGRGQAAPRLTVTRVALTVLHVVVLAIGCNLGSRSSGFCVVLVDVLLGSATRADRAAGRAASSSRHGCRPSMPKLGLYGFDTVHIIHIISWIGDSAIRFSWGH